jgi:hypothetical protein
LFLNFLESNKREPWIRSTFAFDPHPEEPRYHGAVHGALVGALFSGSQSSRGDL